MDQVSTLETYFSGFRANVIGQQVCFDTSFGRKRMLYADWTASGRAYRPIEQELLDRVLPFYGNTHTETTVTGQRMSTEYEAAKRIIRDHVHAGEGDMLLFCGSGMTSAVNKLQRMMGLKGTMPIREEERPLVVVTHMEHHSNHISWLETNATMELIRPDENGDVDLAHLRELLERYRARSLKIAAVTACSNVTGIETPYREIARMMHACGGLCFVDFACSAPYVDIDMHPGGLGRDPGGNVGADPGGGGGADPGGGGGADPGGGGGADLDGGVGADLSGGVGADLDAIYFSVHKFLGGPGTPGVLVFNRNLCRSRVPDQPGGGTLLYSNPWRGREYVDDMEAREDGGTPPILQGIKAGLCIRLKEGMGVGPMLEREAEMVGRLMDRLISTTGVKVLAADHRERLGVISFLVNGVHYDMVVKMLNDRFGIQARGGCSCAGTYGHYLLGIDRVRSEAIREALLKGEMQSKPGWVRLSVHPTMTDDEIDYIADAVEMVAAQYPEWERTRVSDMGGRMRISCPVPRI